jgi:predicted nucleic acid-binding protein
MYLLDTNVVSELRKGTTRKAHRNFSAWAKSVSAPTLFLSAISILELEIGILLMERRDCSQGAILRTWIQDYVLPTFDGRILSVDTPVAQRCAALHVPTPCSERDAMIAATAIVHGMTVVTRNVSDFEPTGVAVINPWQA